MKTPAFIQTILDAASLSGRHVAGLRGDFRSRLAAFRLHRSADEQQKLAEDFRHVLAAWGIADADIPGVISALTCVCRCSPFRCWPASLRRHGRTVRFPSCHWPALHRPVCSVWSRRSGAFPFYVTVALRRCAAGCCSSASVRNGRGVSLLTLIMKGVASCFPEPY